MRYWKCDIQGAVEGPLYGKKVAIKDNIAVAGVPMMNGSRILEGYMPEFDATVVTRILDAGRQGEGWGCFIECFSWRKDGVELNERETDSERER